MTCLENLLAVLKSLEKQPKGDDIIDAKLADYVFFPISHVLRQLEKLPVRARELTLECIGVLLRTAWKENIQPALGTQLMILLTLMADADSQSSKGLKSSEELLALSFRCLSEVFHAMGSSASAQSALSETANMPHLGKAVSVILDGIREGPSAEIQYAAASALASFCKAFTDRQALGEGFFPGIMSGLTKVLTPTTARRSFKVLVQCLDILTRLVPFLFADQELEKTGKSNKSAKNSNPSKEWIKGSAPQVKMAIANIVKLRHHDREPVRKALNIFCLVLLRNCRTNLQDSMPMLLETLITLASDDEAIAQELKFQLAEIAGNDASDFSDSLRSTLYSWLVSMPRVMLKADESPKQTLIRQIAFSFRLLQEQGEDTGILDNMLASTLRDSVVSAIQVSDKSKPGPPPPIETLNMELVPTKQAEFEPILAIRKTQESTILEISSFLKQLSTQPSSLQIAKALLPSLPNLTGDTQLSTFWLTLNVIRNNLTFSLSLDSILNLGHPTTSTNPQSLLDELYAFALQIIVSSATMTEQRDYRLQCLALETLALQAQQLQQDFRTELIDVLYPVLHALGSPSPILRNHAMVALNIITFSTGYASAAETAVANVDYLVNDIALRLNAFDISPQAPRVLVMMVRLVGPRLLPYLDDVVESVFVALENFHGYSGLVEGLFGALCAVVESGVKVAELRAIEGGEGKERHKIARVKSASVEAVVGLVRGMKRKRDETRTSDFTETGESLPHRPWKGESKEESSTSAEEDPDAAPPTDDTDNDALTRPEEEDAKPPAEKIYTLLLQISKLTQHYLPSSSAPLRTSLLSLLTTVIPALAKHENAFLPLVHELWPVVVARLEDDEAYVVAGAMDVMGLMGVEAGAFMKGRVEDVWPALRRVWRVRAGGGGLARESRIVSGKGRSRGVNLEGLSNVVALRGKESDVGEGGGQFYVQAPARIIGDAFITLMCRILQYVGMSDEMFDECLDMLVAVAEKRGDVRKALEDRNPDAVWLGLWRRGKDRDARRDDLKEVERPTGRKEWRFQFAEMV